MSDPVRAPEDRADLGLGRVLSQQSQQRFLNRDGSVNSRKLGLKGRAWQQLYHGALSLTWPAFLAWAAALFLLVNGVFALLYLSLGPAALANTEATGIPDGFLRALFFSIATFTTSSTGPVHPVGETAAWLVAAETLLGVLALVTGAGLLVARLVRPRVEIRFSSSAVFAPYQGGTGLMFRMVNMRPSELINVNVKMNLAWFEEVDGQRVRRFHGLALERSHVEFFTMHWTIVHALDERSPLRGLTPERWRASDAELLILVTALEETFSTTVHARTSYCHDEVTWHAKFGDMFVATPDGVITVDVERLDRVERLG